MVQIWGDEKSKAPSVNTDGGKAQFSFKLTGN